MSAGNPHDPELHLLRSIARSLDGRASTEVESARFGVFAATESGDSDGARRWLASLKYDGRDDDCVGAVFLVVGSDRPCPRGRNSGARHDYDVTGRG